MVETNKLLTIDEMLCILREECFIKISKESIHTILHKHLDLTKVCACWVVHSYLTDLVAEHYAVGIDRLIHRCNKWLDNAGNYVGK